MTTPKVSVIIPIYNVEKYLKQCLDSVVNQTLTDIEIICIDDCGTDNSVNVVIDIMQSDKRIKLIKNSSNKGPGPSRNTGIKFAKGEYIFFLDSDDILELNALEKLYKIAKNNDFDIIASKTNTFCDGNDEDMQAKTGSMNEWLNYQKAGTYKINIENLANAITSFNCVVWGKLFLTRFIKKHELYFINDKTLMEDIGYWIKVLSQFPTIAETDIIGVNYRRRKNAITDSIDQIDQIEEKYLNITRTVKDVIKYINSHVEKKYKNKIITKIKESPYNYTFSKEKMKNKISQEIANKIRFSVISPIKLVSIILPTYNGAKYIKESIDSILSQTYQNWELIIVNDGSTDNTLDIIKQYAKNNNQIKIINNTENQKLPKSLNIGFSQANGEYFTWTSDDNRYKPNAIETMVKYLENFPKYDFICTNCDFIDSNGNITFNTKQCWEQRNEKQLCYFNNVVACFLYRRQIADAVGLYDASLFGAEDYDYWCKIAIAGNMLYIDENLYEYRFQENSLTSRQPDVNDTAALKVKKKYLVALASKLNYSKTELAKIALKLYDEYNDAEFKKIAQKSNLLYYLFSNKQFKKNIQFLFSIKNKDKHKVITILGIKLKFKSKKLIEQKR